MAKYFANQIMMGKLKLEDVIKKYPSLEDSIKKELKKNGYNF